MSGTQAKPNSGSGIAKANDAMSRKKYNQIHDGTQDLFRLTNSTGASGRDDTVAGKDYPLDTIKVDSTLEVV